jgi:hypothetical protein
MSALAAGQWLAGLLFVPLVQSRNGPGPAEAV